MLYPHQFQKFGLRSNHGNYPESVSFRSWEMNRIDNAKDIRRILQALNYRGGNILLPENPGPANAAVSMLHLSDFTSRRAGCGSEIEHARQKTENVDIR